MTTRHTDPVKRFWSKVDMTESCWNWTASILKSGYGQFSVDGKPMRAHRYSFELHNGPINEGMVIDHMCHNRKCVNPTHLRSVTHKQNMENRAGHCSGNVSNARGVSRTPFGTWTARVKHDRQSYYLGTYKTIEEAAAAAYEFRKKHFLVSN